MSKNLSPESGIDRSKGEAGFESARLFLEKFLFDKAGLVDSYNQLKDCERDVQAKILIGERTAEDLIAIFTIRENLINGFLRIIFGYFQRKFGSNSVGFWQQIVNDCQLDDDLKQKLLEVPMTTYELSGHLQSRKSFISSND